MSHGSRTLTSTYTHTHKLHEESSQEESSTAKPQKAIYICNKLIFKNCFILEVNVCLENSNTLNNIFINIKQQFWA